MKNRLTIICLVITILLASGCSLTSLTTKEQKMSREEAELKAFNFVYEHTQNKEVYDKEPTAKNYVFDSWKEENTWHVILYVSHTFIEVLVYDDGSDQIKVLTKTDYWKKVPKNVKNEIKEKTSLI